MTQSGNMNQQSMKQLFNSAASQGTISPDAEEVLVENLNGVTVAGAQGVSPDDLETSDVTLFVLVVDRSGSMDGVSGEVVTAYNDLLQALKDSKAAESVLMSAWLFNSSPQVLHGYLALKDVPQMNQRIYSADGGTALYKTVLDAFTSVVAYRQTLYDAGINTKVVVVVMTDGDDNDSGRITASQVATVARSLLDQEVYTLALVAFGLTYQADRIAQNMGFPLQNVLKAGSDPSSIRRAMNTVSKSTIRASQTQINPSQSFFN